MKAKLWALAVFAAALSLALPEPAWAAVVTQSETYLTSLWIPDNDSTGISDTRTLSMPGVAAISRVEVSLKISGGYNGDYYAYLRRGDTGFAVLLNRVGVTATTPDGYADPGLNVKLADSSLNPDIHSYQAVFNPDGAILTGIWQPDGRAADPSLVTEETARSATLSSFQDLDPNGTWTLFIADTSPLGIGKLESWSLAVEGALASVPEPSNALVGGLFAGSLLVCRRALRTRRPTGAEPLGQARNGLPPRSRH
jgi:subtilisin-like proprotein convertase family protein